MLFEKETWLTASIVLLCESTREGDLRYSRVQRGPSRCSERMRVVYNGRVFEGYRTPHYNSGQLHINVLAGGSALVPAAETAGTK